jgi:hypothetical protein
LKVASVAAKFGGGTASAVPRPISLGAGASAAAALLCFTGALPPLTINGVGPGLSLSAVLSDFGESFDASEVGDATSSAL